MSEEASRQTILLKYAILVGMTPLIPLPLLDDLAQGYFERRMFERLVASHQITMTEAQIDGLGAPADPAGCVKGCFTALLLYPLKKILRKIFFFLEIKRTVDLIASTYARGMLLDRMLQRRLCAPAGPHEPARIRQATDQALQRVGTSPIELAVRHSFHGSTELIRRLGDQLFAALRRLTRGASRQQVAEAVQSVEEQPSEELRGVEQQVEKGLKSVPEAHFQKLEEAALEALGQPVPEKS
jgi:hypothetical protein